MTTGRPRKPGRTRKRPAELEIEKDDIPGVIRLPRVDVARMRLHRNITGLCQTLEKADERSASYAAEFLADIGSPEASDALLACLAAEPPSVLRDTVIRCLGQLKERRAIPLLIAELHREGWAPARRCAIWALGEIDDPQAVPPLLTMLDWGYTSYREEALAALERIGDTSAVPGILAALWDLLPRLDDGSTYPDGTAAVRTLGRLGSPHATSALAFLVGVSWLPSALRRAAAEALRRIDVAPAAGYGRLTFAKTALGDPDPYISSALAEVFSQTPGGLQELRWALTRENPIVRRSACVGLGINGDPEDVPAIQTLLVNDPDPTVRNAAATALARVGGPSAESALLESLENTGVQEDAARVLATMKRPPAARLLTLLTDGTDQQQYAAAVALGLMGEQRAAPHLLVIVTSTVQPRIATRIAAVDALGRLRYAQATTHLIALLDDEETPGRLRARAAWALGQLGNPEAIPALQRALHGPGESIRLRAAEALGTLPISPETVTVLAQAVADDNSLDVQQAALQTLGNLGSNARPALHTLLPSTEGQLRTDVIALLARCAESADISILTEIAIEDDTLAALHATKGIGQLHDPRTIEPLRRILERPEKWDSHIVNDVRAAAIRALSQIDDPTATEAVLGYFMNECTARVHDAARAAVNAIAERT